MRHAGAGVGVRRRRAQGRRVGGGLSDVTRAGGQADPDVVARWLDEGCAPNGECGRGFSKSGVHGFDLTFCAPKSVSLLRAVRGDDVAAKAVLDAHATAISEALEYLAAHAGYSRIHNPITGEKDLIRLPGLVAAAYQHETSRAGDPHLHTHVLVPNRQPRADGKLVSLDGTSLYHEARAAGMLYQATLRRELHVSLGVEWASVDPATGMAEIAAFTPASVRRAWSRRSTQLREWAADNLTVVDPANGISQAQLAAAQKATRPRKPESLSWAQLREQWRADTRGLVLDRAAHEAAAATRRATAAAGGVRARLAAAAASLDKAAFTRADLIEVVAAQIPVELNAPRMIVETAVDQIGVRLTGPRLAHQREGSERFTLSEFLAEEAAVLDLVDATDPRASMWIRDDRHASGLSPDQARAVRAIAETEQLVCPLSAPAGAGKTTSMRALRSLAKQRHSTNVIVVAPTGRAVDVAVREGAGDTGYTVTKALNSLQDGSLTLGHLDLVVVDEAAMIGTPQLHQLLAATTAAHCKTVLVGDAYQLAPVKARGGMFAQLCADLPWTQRLSEVWRMRDPQERSASLALREGGPAPSRRAVSWYRRHGRLHAGDQIAMASDALGAYRADVAAGKDALLLTDTVEMADALNRRIHDHTITADADTITAGRGHRIAEGDVIISRRNEPGIRVHDGTDIKMPADPVRNGQRWTVFAVDPQGDRIAARRLDDGARAVFSGDYLHEHVTHGYAVTVHSAQGVTADTTHAVLAETTSRNLEPGVHVARRGTSAQAAQLVRSIIGTRDERARTAHDIAAQAQDREQLPEHVQSLLIRRANALQGRRAAYRHRHDQRVEQALERDRWINQHLSRDRRDQGLDYGLEL
nr:MobF family relaxase [Mycobacterium avium]